MWKLNFCEIIEVTCSKLQKSGLIMTVASTGSWYSSITFENVFSYLIFFCFKKFETYITGRELLARKEYIFIFVKFLVEFEKMAKIDRVWAHFQGSQFTRPMSVCTIINSWPLLSIGVTPRPTCLFSD